MGYEYLACGNVMLDSVRFPGETTRSQENIGGPSTFAYSGIKLYTDKVGYDYYKRVGLLGLYDGGIEVDTLEHLPSTIDYRIFWAGAKLFAPDCPFHSIDPAV